MVFYSVDVKEKDLDLFRTLFDIPPFTCNHSKGRYLIILDHEILPESQRQIMEYCFKGIPKGICLFYGNLKRFPEPTKRDLVKRISQVPGLERLVQPIRERLSLQQEISQQQVL